MPSRALSRALLPLAAVAVAVAAADTYVIVLALPDVMHGVGLSVDDLQKGAPIVSGFLLGYVAMLPLIGRIADLRGRPPVLVAGLMLFAFGSVVTALSYDLPMLVIGRFVQGVGGGALVPATLALVADLYPVSRRAVPLGIVSAVQELGSVLGPLVGAAILAVSTWQGIFGVNMLLGLVLGGLIAVTARQRWSWDPVALVLLAATVVSGTVLAIRPPAILTDLTWGRLFIPVYGDSSWATPLGLATIVAGLLFLARSWWAKRPLVDLRSWVGAAREADLVGSLFLAVALGGIVLAFATADPKVQAMSPQGGWYLLAAALAAVAFAVHLRRSSNPLIPPATFRPRAAWGAVATSLLVGFALVAALVDVPLFARTTVYPDSQLLAALVLLRFLVAVPIGAVAGGWLVHRLPTGLVAAAGMLAACAGLFWMSHWGPDSLHHLVATVPLAVAGLGFGLALAPVNSAVLAATASDVHGLASAAVVVARMIGMLVGVSVLTTLGLRRYYAEQGSMPSIAHVCGSAGLCDKYERILQLAGIAQEHTVFLGASVAALAAAALAAATLSGRPAS